MDIPETAVGLIIGAGLLLILASVFGGGLEVKEVKIPAISRGMRAFAFVLGTVLVAVPMLPEPSFPEPLTQPDLPKPLLKSEVGEAATLEDLTGLDVDIAIEKIESVGLNVRDQLNKKRWVANDTVIAQSEIGTVAAGALVDVTLADSRFSFVAERRVRTKDEDYTVTFEYQVQRIGRSEESDIAEVTVASFDISPRMEEMSELMDHLLTTSLFVDVSRVSQFDLATHWDALAQLQQNLGDTMATDSLSSDTQSLKSLGPGILLSFLTVEIEFDVRSILLTQPNLRGRLEPIDLQIASKMKSAIRVVDDGVLTDQGQSNAFEIVRQKTDETAFKTVGRAKYSREDGLLESLTASFHLGISEDAYYQLSTTRQ